MILQAKTLLLTIFLGKVFSLKIDLEYPNEIIHTRVRRGISDSGTIPAICKKALNDESKKKIEKNTWPLKGDKNHDVSLVWLGVKRETQILLTTMKLNPFLQILNLGGISKSPTNIYKSTNGGKTFDKLEEKDIGKEAIRTSYGILKSPVDPDRVILVSYVRSSFFETMMGKPKNGSLVISKDGGKNFKEYKLPFKLREGDSIRFHQRNKDWIIALEKITIMTAIFSKSMKKIGSAFISKDFGETWTCLMANEIVEDVKWGTKKNHEDDIFLLKKVVGGSFLMHGFGTASDSVLYKSSNQKKFEVIVESCGSFGVQDEYVFATVTFEVEDVEKRIIHVSHDSGEKFYKIHTPAITSDKFFAILEMYKGLIFLHISEDEGKGTIYISGPEGRVFEKSLKDHFYTEDGDTDFYNIESMPGVYITQVLLEKEENTLTSVITFDRGVKWQPLYVDRKKYCQDKKYIDNPKLACSLHYHHKFSKKQRHTIAVYVEPPLSSSKAPGLILLHGQAGDALTGRMNVWMSKNGGYNWKEIAKGPHHYAIADNGNLIVLVPKINSTGTTLKYSIDQGRCWHDFEFTDANQPLVVLGLVTEPNSQERTFSLWGYRKDVKIDERIWIVVTVDFNNMFANKCKNDDFENWYPHVLNGKEGCFLGEKMTFKRPKEDKVCYVGPDFNPIVKINKCKCTDSDIVCEYGYERNNQNKCVRNKELKLMFCEDGEEELESDSKGYRLVPGDMCDHTSSSKNHIKLIDQEKKCSKAEIEQEKESEVGIVNEEERRIKAKQHEDYLNKEFDRRTNHSKEAKKKKKNIPLLVFGVVLVIGLVVAAAWYARRYMKLRKNTTLSYTRSNMNGLGDDDEVNEGNADDGNEYGRNRRQNENFFQDESDADDEALLTV